MSVIYLGSFPPPYGGVTIKNKNLFQMLHEQIDITYIDFSEIKKKPFRIMRLIAALVNRDNRFVIGVSGRRTRKIFTVLLAFANRSSMNKSILIVMGGTASYDMANDALYRKCVRQYKSIYVETLGMKTELMNASINNAHIFPNGRYRSSYMREIKRNNKIRCVFFSKICEQKGCSIILETAAVLPDVDFAFYGDIDPEYKEYFITKIGRLSNANYLGVFKGTTEEVYDELSKYDILLFPTKYAIEGVPGVLVEAKISGIAVIASDLSYNSEIVEDGKNGFILSDNTAEEMVSRIRQYMLDDELLYHHRLNSWKSAEYYYIDNYILEIISDIIS